MINVKFSHVEKLSPMANIKWFLINSDENLPSLIGEMYTIVGVSLVDQHRHPLSLSLPNETMKRIGFEIAQNPGVIFDFEFNDFYDED